jgi:small conductance mechanosensitive channel
MTTPDNRLIYVPNSQVAGAQIINYTREKNRRVDMAFSVPYEAPAEAVKAALLEVAESDGRTLHEPAPFVGLLAYRDGTAEYVLRAWTKNEDYWGFYFEANERVRETLEARGISMAPRPLGVRLEE